MKRIIAMLLAVLLLTGVASAAFSDEKTIDPKYADAVTAMSEKGIIAGFEDGSFKPKDTLTRAQAAKILCAMLAGENIPEGKTEFTDVPAGHWAEKYVAYCAEKGIVAGVGSGKYNPNGKLTEAAFAKMLLVAYGHDAEKEGLVGEKWVVNTQKTMKSTGMNYQVGTTENPIQRQVACRMAYNFFRTAEIDAAEGYTEKTIKLTASNAKLLGRARQTDKGIEVLYGGDGVEFTVDCKGVITLNFTAGEKLYFAAFVDGEQFPLRISGTTSLKEGTAAQFVAPGEHTIRIIRDNQISTSDLHTFLNSVTLSCKAEPKPTAKKNLLIDVIGDSITSGSGSIGTNDTDTSNLHSSVAKTYGYLAAVALDADYTIVSKNGIGITKASGGVKADELYRFEQAYWSKDVKYGFARKADVVVCSIGQNDKTTDDAGEQAFYDAMAAWLKEIRSIHGDKCKIVICYNFMNVRHSDTMVKLAEDLGGAGKNGYALQMEQGHRGGKGDGNSTGHPDAAEHAVNGQKLAEFLKSIL